MGGIHAHSFTSGLTVLAHRGILAIAAQAASAQAITALTVATIFLAHPVFAVTTVTNIGLPPEQ